MTILYNKLKSAFLLDWDEAKEYKIPIIAGIVLVYITTLFVQRPNKLSFRSVLLLTMLIAVHILLYCFFETIFKRRYWIYFLIQGIIIFDCAVIIPMGYQAIFIGLIPILICQSIMVYYETLKIVVVSLFFYGIFCGTIIALNGIKELITYVPMLIIITIAVRVYSAIFLKQVKLRVQTQKILKELELAYERVEELTLINERQRMARDLHDTLSQGLAGIIMQLEAVNANLNNNNTKRAQEIIRKSMEYARATLADSRLVIDDLRLKSNIDVDFKRSIENEIIRFRSTSNISITSNVKIVSEIPQKVLKHILYIVREALNNIKKHAKAENVLVKVIEENNQIKINIIDDGIGFDIKLLDKLFGHYGILGMTERVKAINGEIKIKSKRKSGTSINIIIPIEKGIEGENE